VEPKWFAILWDLQLDFLVVVMGAALPLMYLFSRDVHWPPTSITQWIPISLFLLGGLTVATWWGVRLLRGVLAAFGHKWGRKFKPPRMGRAGRIGAYLMAPVLGAMSLLSLLGVALHCLMQDDALSVLLLLTSLGGTGFIQLFLLCTVLRAIDEGRQERDETKH
jgi:hypothetical protein